MDFNLRFARAIKHYVRDRQGTFNNWDPVIFQLGTPMSWSSQPSHVRSLRGNIDYLLSTISLETNLGSPSSLHMKFIGNPGNAAGIPVIAHRAAHAIVQVLTEREARFHSEVSDSQKKRRVFTPVKPSVIDCCCSF